MICPACEMEYEAAFGHSCPPPAPPGVVEMTVFLLKHKRLGRVSREFKASVVLGAKVMDGSLGRSL